MLNKCLPCVETFSRNLQILVYTSCLRCTSVIVSKRIEGHRVEVLGGKQHKMTSLRGCKQSKHEKISETDFPTKEMLFRGIGGKCSRFHPQLENSRDNREFSKLLRYFAKTIPNTLTLSKIVRICPHASRNFHIKSKTRDPIITT